MWLRPNSWPIAFIIIRRLAMRYSRMFTGPGAGSAGNPSSQTALQACFGSFTPPSQRVWFWASFSFWQQAASASAAPSAMKACMAQPIGRPEPKSPRRGCCLRQANLVAGSMSVPGMNRRAVVAGNNSIICGMTAPSTCSPSRQRVAAKASAWSCPRFSPGRTASSSTIRRPSSGT